MRTDAAESAAAGAGKLSEHLRRSHPDQKRPTFVGRDAPAERAVLGGQRGEAWAEVVAPPDAHAGPGVVTRSVSQARQSAYRREIASGCAAHHRGHQLIPLVGLETRRRSTTWER